MVQFNFLKENLKVCGGGGGSVRGEASRRCVSVNDIRRAFEKAEQSLASSVKGGPGSGSGSSGAGSGISPSHNRMSSLDSTASDESSIPTPSGSHNYYGSVSSLVSGRENLKDHYGSITSLASSTSLISPQVHLHSNLDNKGRRPSTIYFLCLFAGASGSDRRGQSVFGGERNSLARDHGDRAPP